ncbi:PTS transporter subunit EIIC [Saccharibacillus kuerlensis]|uniref:PTS acetylglucosamine transporter subunit IIB n=1 Tax=Saccharibacillus kuerlensis TaxID=459527 RepID=A0ABQ2KSU1_9BACL|nr:PTS transporter subunit EIIC [Saccharibacillus kuerlensis]GGN91205.1 PTS acetylglucosamine transporter subunit IIB [Saccharibacillus kuerlensis]
MLGFLQKLGRSLMLPVATLPAAAILQGLGLLDYEKDIPLGSTIGGFLNQYVAPFLNVGAGTIFGSLPLIFAIGVAIGFAGDAVAALSALIAYLILSSILEALPGQMPFIGDDVVLNMGVLGGIFAGGWAAFLYKRYHNVKMPEWLGFFAGKRFVPIITAASTIVLSVLIGMIWSPVQDVISVFGNWVVGLGEFGAFAFGTANRLLVPIGLHHVLNSIAWFQIGDFTNAAGEVVHGDLTRFFAGDPTAGMFMTGFFPIMMFALPGAALAFIHTAKPKNRKAVASIFISAAVASFLTGITEPLEFSFMFVAPVLYVVHAVLTGLSGLIMYVLDVRLGFGFSAGLIDYLVNMKLSNNAWLLLPVGLVFFAVYYVLFRFIIQKFNLQTPGREDDFEAVGEVSGGNAAAGNVLAGNATANVQKTSSDSSSRSAQILEHVGGAANIVDIDACVTRLRLVVGDDKAVDDAALKRLGASGVMRLGQGAVQIVFGTQSERIKNEIEKML